MVPYRLRWLRAWWRRCWVQTIPRWIATQLPARLVYWCFIRVHANAESHWSFDAVADAWMDRHRLNP
jgi:hypothetical protein